jgi:hypothetical protein
VDPRLLIGPSSSLGLPAPFGFLQFFKVLGFTLHMVPMHLWYAGVIVAVLLRGQRHEHAQRLGVRLIKAMPIFIALGVNLGIVPLLFTQVAYHRVFYPATILMAWPWLGIPFLLMFAYYGVYIYASALRKGGQSFRSLPQTAGWMSALFFVLIGFLFANGFSLMTRLSEWPSLWQHTNVAGAPLGIGLNIGDPSLWPRWLLMFGLALLTTSAYIALDVAFLCSKETEGYRRWVKGFSWKLYLFGILWFGATGSWYVFCTWPPELRQLMTSRPLGILFVLTAISPGLVWLLMLVQMKRATRSFALLAGIAQLGVLALNGVSRQVVQNTELKAYLDVAAERVVTQWSPLILFLVLFAAGLAVVGWMVAKAAQASGRPTPAG